MNYKVCVYAICKNEIQMIEQWLERAKEADYIVVLDTGSTDGTWELLQQKAIICAQEIIAPFRFDVARNKAMNLIPKDCDICLPLDIDQYATKDFVKKIKQHWRKELSALIMPQYYITTNTCGRWFAHSRNNIVWNYPVYEQISFNGSTKQITDIIIIHIWDKDKNSHQIYSELANLAIQENPQDPYCKQINYLINKRYNQ